MSIPNKDIIKTVVSELPSEHAEKFKDVETGAEILTVFENYPTTKNAFIDTLQNKVVKSVIYSKAYANSLKELKKGFLEFGDTIEELFVQMAQSKNFNDHWNEDGTDEADLIRALKPKVLSLYVQRNFDKDYKTTVFDKVLRKAFISEYGLNNLVQQIVLSINNAIEYHEFEYTKDAIIKFVEEFKVLADDTYQSIPNTATKQTISACKVTGAKQLVQKVREVTGNMKFMSDKYNVAKVKTFSNPSDLVFITTPSVVSDMDVNVLANAFNVSSSDLKTRILEVDALPKSIVKVSKLGVDGECEVVDDNNITSENVKVLGVLMDKDLLQIWDNYQGSGTFYNPAKHYTNHFANREGTFATCLFANVCVFYE